MPARAPRTYNPGMPGPALRFRSATGPALRPWLDAVARLRIAVFREWPYLYDGSLDYERDYLAAHASPDAICVLAFDGDEVVGASTGLPLADETAAFRAPFLARGIDPATVFHFGESVLQPDCRGRGAGHAFFDAREAHARSLGRFGHTAFAAVDRDPADPRRPPGHRDHAAFWQGRGYARQPGMAMALDWDEVGTGAATHALTFWLRSLERAA